MFEHLDWLLKEKMINVLGRFADLDSKATVYYVNFELFVNIIGVSLEKKKLKEFPVISCCYMLCLT